MSTSLINPIILAIIESFIKALQIVNKDEAKGVEALAMGLLKVVSTGIIHRFLFDTFLVKRIEALMDFHNMKYWVKQLVSSMKGTASLAQTFDKCHMDTQPRQRSSEQSPELLKRTQK